jgi:hypothetical protein
MPVGSGQIDGAARDTQPDGELLPACDRIAEPDSAPPYNVTEMPYPTKFHQNDTIRIAPDRQPGFKDDVGSGLAGGANLGILVAIRIFGPERDDLIRGEEDDHRLRVGKSGIYYLAHIRAGFPGGDQGFVPLDRGQPNGSQEREDRATRRPVAAVHHEHPPLPLGCWVPQPWLTAVPGRTRWHVFRRLTRLMALHSDCHRALHHASLHGDFFELNPQYLPIMVAMVSLQVLLSC